MKIKLEGIDKALQCDKSFTSALTKVSTGKRTPLTQLKGGLGARKLTERDIHDAQVRKQKLEAERIVQQTLMNARLLEHKKAK